ncbi:MAG: hypothetical protein WC375_06990 [Methanomassiliicoccales archaeon]|jgi:hypothetical protein
MSESISSLNALQAAITPRYSDERWKIQVKRICEQLGTYSYLEVKNELKGRTRPKKDEDDKIISPRKDVGCYLPTDRQLQQYLSRAEWSVEVKEPQKHRPAQYEFAQPYKPSPKS